MLFYTRVYYKPQLHWQMEVTQTRKAALSVTQGGKGSYWLRLLITTKPTPTN